MKEREERDRKPVKVTRSREYRKNDNAHVEQRNNSVPRRWLSYERIDFSELVPLVNYYFRDIICPLMNHFFPCFKLTEKIVIKSRTRRIYKDPVTPYARVMTSPHVPADKKRILEKIHASLNPLKLSRQEQEVRKRIDSALRKLRCGQDATGLLTVPPRPAPFFQMPSPVLAPSKEGAAQTTANNVSSCRVLPTRKTRTYNSGTISSRT